MRVNPVRLERTGHIHLADGSILRIDYECKHYCASWYTPTASLKAYAVGPLDAMTVVVAAWADAFNESRGHEC
jgi:hypothetical protein